MARLRLVLPGQLQIDLFAPMPRPRSAELMAAMDKINGQMGRGTVRLAAVPYEAGWGMKQQLKSPGYVSRWGEIREVQ